MLEHVAASAAECRAESAALSTTMQRGEGCSALAVLRPHRVLSETMFFFKALSSLVDHLGHRNAGRALLILIKLTHAVS